MTIEKARELLGDEVEGLTDEEMIDFMQKFGTILDAVLDDFIKMTPEEMKKFSKKKSNTPQSHTVR
jgi:hypothetical protein